MPFCLTRAISDRAVFPWPAGICHSCIQTVGVEHQVDHRLRLPMKVAVPVGRRPNAGCRTLLLREGAAARLAPGAIAKNTRVANPRDQRVHAAAEEGAYDDEGNAPSQPGHKRTMLSAEGCAPDARSGGIP